MARYGRRNFEPVSSTHSPRMGDLTVGDYANGMPNIRLGEMFKSFMRQLFWIIPLFVLGFILAGYATKDLKRVYSGDASVLVQLGEEYVYSPVGPSTNGSGLTTTIDTITLTEAGLMRNDELIAQVIGEMTSPRTTTSGRTLTERQAQNLFDEDAYRKINAARSKNNRRAEQDAIMELRNSVASSYTVSPRAKSSIIDVSYKHDDPDVAVDTVNQFVRNYLDFRRKVFEEGSSEIIAERRAATEEQLNANERSIARFLKKNDVADFSSEQAGLQERTEDLKASLNGTRASIAETEAALAQVEDQLRGTPPTIDLYRDDRASQRIAQAELELGQLMAKYLPTSDPVKQKQTELNELRRLMSSYGGKASGGRRVGPNPTHQALTTQRNNLAARADSLREREFTQQRQLNSADAKIRKLTSLSPTYENLLRERETLKSRLNSYNAKEQEALVDAQQAESQAENVKVISEAQYANKGRNMRKLAWFGASLAWLLVLFFLAMIRVFLDPRLYAVPNRVQAAPQDSYADTGSAYAPIPEAVPVYDPSQRPVPNPYEAQPAAYGGAEQYSQPGGYAAPEHYNQPMEYADYNASAYADPYAAHPAEVPYQAGYDSTAQQGTFGGTAALDLSHNPYATGEVQAGSLNPIPPQMPPNS